MHVMNMIMTVILSISFMEKIFGGNRRKKNLVATVRDAVDLQNEKNGTGVCYQESVSCETSFDSVARATITLGTITAASLVTDRYGDHMMHE